MAQATTPPVEVALPTDSEHSSEALVTALYDVVRHSRRALDTAGLEPAAVVVLASASRLSPARPSDIACDIRLDLSTVSRHLRNLESGGYLDRADDPDDRRAHRVAPTLQGSTSLHAVLAARSHVVDGALSHWSDDDRRTLTALLRRLADDLMSASETRRETRKADA